MLELYQRDPYQRVLRTSVLEVTTVKKKPAIHTADRILYPGGGGQPCDAGFVTLSRGRRVAVTRVLRMNGRAYAVLAEDAALNVGDEVEIELDWERRYRNMRCHTSTHVLNGALAKSVEGYASQGIDVSEDGLMATTKFDGTWPAAREAALTYIETSNDLIAAGRPVTITEYESLPEAIARFGTIYRGPTDLRGPISIVVIDGWDANPCGGTHVEDIREVGPLTLVDFGPSHVRFALRP